MLEELAVITRRLGLFDNEEGGIRMLASLVSASREFIGVADLEGNALFVNEAGRKLVGLRDLEAVRETRIIDYFAADDHDKILHEVLPAVRATGFWEGELTFTNFETGQLIPVLYNIFPVRDSSGAATAYGTVTRNLADSKRSQEQITTLAREAEHRSKNLLATVGALVNLSQGDTSGALKTAIEGRIQALANVNSIFVETRWIGAELSAIAAQEFAPFDEKGKKRFRIDGPPTLLDPNTAQAVAVILHELATNAAKYGALSNAQGNVDLTWQKQGDGPLALCWTEASGPVVKEPSREGFGSKVIKQMVRQIGGETQFNWHPDGLVCEIKFPT